MKFLAFTFYTFSVLPIIFLEAMEEKAKKKIQLFQPKSLQVQCIRSFYAPALNDKEDQVNEIYSIGNINTLNKRISLTLYPMIAYHILKTEKVCVRDKYALISFLRDYPEQHEKKVEKILNFFTEFIETNNYYYSTLLKAAIHCSVKPWIVNFLLENGEAPNPSHVWQLIGNEKARPEIHRYNTRKLVHILRCDVPLKPRSPIPFIPSSGLKPFEYAQDMLICWQDTIWTKGYKEKKFNKYFKPKLYEAQSQETIEEYKFFFSEVVDLLLPYEQKAQ